MGLDVWTLIDRLGIFFTLLLMAIIWWHVIRCDHRNSKLWDKVEKTSNDISEVKADISEIRGYLKGKHKV